MAHRYGHPITIQYTGSQLAGFRWRGARYRIVEVLATWHLRDRWWEADATPTPATPAASSTASAASPVRTTTPADLAIRARTEPLAASDRLYYRVRCASEQVFDVYYDAAGDVWMLDRAHD